MLIEDIRAQVKGSANAWQIVREHDDGTWAIMTGYGTPITFCGYQLPDKRIDSRRVTNRDVRDMSMAELKEEEGRIRALEDAYVAAMDNERLRSVAFMHPFVGSVTLGEWIKDRLGEINKLIFYGRK